MDGGIAHADGEHLTTRSAPYGKACSRCSRAKSRCIPSGSGGCQRCNRLAKDCTPSATVRRSGASKRRSKKSQIEEKLDGLVSLLQSQNPGRLPEESGGVTPLPSLGSERNGLHQDPASRSGHTPSIPLPSTSPRASPGSEHGRYEIQELSPSCAKRRLHRFRTQHLALFPMLRISEHETAQSLRLQRPFLWLNICAVCAGSAAEQCALGDKARDILAKRVIVDCDRDLDLLEGLLVYLSWCTFFSSGKLFMSTFSHVAVSMIFDLRMTKPERPDMVALPYLNCFAASNFRQPLKPSSVVIPAHSHATWRATLAAYINVINFNAFMRFDVHWTQGIADSLSRLEENPEGPGDELLMAMARVMRVAEETARLARTTEGSARSPHLTLHIPTLVALLNQVTLALPPHIQQNKILMAVVYSTDVLVHQLVLLDHSSTSTTGLHDLQRIEQLAACLQAAKTHLDLWVTFEPAECAAFSFITLVHFAYTIQVLYRLLHLSEPGWDRSVVRKQVDVLYYLGLAASRFDQAHLISDIDDNGPEVHVFKKAAAALRATMASWGTSLDHVAGLPPAGSVPPGADTLAEPPLTDLLDDHWISDIFASWDGV